MREDLLHLMLLLHPDDAAALAAAGRGPHRERLVERLPRGHEYSAAVPSVFGSTRAVLALSEERLRCVPEAGEGFVLDLGDVHRIHLETMGLGTPRPVRLDLHLADRVVELPLSTLHPDSAGFFARAVERAVEDAHRAPPAREVPAPVADELMKLTALRDRGVLTDEEFRARKAHLLR